MYFVAIPGANINLRLAHRKRLCASQSSSFISTGSSLREALTAPSGRGRGWGRASQLRFWLLCHCRKDWIAFFSMCTYLFTYFCLCFWRYSPVVGQRSTSAVPKTCEDPPFLVFFVVGWEYLKSGTSCWSFIAFSLAVSRLFTYSLFLIPWNILLCALSYVTVCNHYSLFLCFWRKCQPMQIQSCHFPPRFGPVHIGLLCGRVSSSHHRGFSFIFYWEGILFTGVHAWDGFHRKTETI